MKGDLGAGIEQIGLQETAVLEESLPGRGVETEKNEQWDKNFFPSPYLST